MVENQGMGDVCVYVRLGLGDRLGKVTKSRKDYVGMDICIGLAPRIDYNKYKYWKDGVK